GGARDDRLASTSGESVGRTPAHPLRQIRDTGKPPVLCDGAPVWRADRSCRGIGTACSRAVLPKATIPLSSLPQTSNNIIQKGLAFVREQSGSVIVPGTKRPSGSCPAGCMAEVGLRWWRQ